jgi:hypothetical protein
MISFEPAIVKVPSIWLHCSFKSGLLFFICKFFAYMQAIDLHDVYVAVSTSGVAAVSISNTTTLDHMSKYKPLQITKSPRNCRTSHGQGKFPLSFMLNQYHQVISVYNHLTVWLSD